jgi:hypothetical protein
MKTADSMWRQCIQYNIPSFTQETHALKIMFLIFCKVTIGTLCDLVFERTHVQR